MPKGRVKLSLSRWWSIVSCGIVAATILALFDPLLRKLCAPAADRLSNLGPIGIAMTLAVLGITVCWWLGRGRWPGFFGLQFSFSYPPLWVAMLVALGVLLQPVFWLGLLLATGALMIARLTRGFRMFLHARTTLPDRRVKSNRGAAQDDFDRLRAWLLDDSEIETPDSDRFQHDEIARRIARRLSRIAEAPTMAVIGPLGSGKSTIGRLVEYHLRDKPSVRFVRVSLWPFGSSEAAVGGILRAVLDEVGRHVNIMSLAGLTEDYVTAIEKAAGRYGGIARLLRGTQDPKRIVERFSEIACAAGLRIVLWIEDLERFSGGDQLDDPYREQREVERLGPIWALLYLLDRSPEVSVVVSDTSLRTRFDITKIARFVEHPPTIDAQGAWDVTNLLRTRCLGGYPSRVIDPTAPEVREAFAPGRDPFDLDELLSSISHSRPNIVTAIARVLSTPRVFKWALRITLETWETLAGEIDFDSVLVASALRVAHPDLFALVSEHIDSFRNGMTNLPSAGGEEGKPHQVVDRTNDLLGREEMRRAKALHALLHFLFPKFPPGEGQGDDKEYVARPQALFVDDGADYWRRYRAQTQIAETDSDQKALASIAAWRDGNASDLVDRIIDPKLGSQIHRFVGQFLPSHLCRLLGEVAERVIAESAAQWYHRAHAPGVAAVWGMMFIKKPSQDAVFRTVVDILQRTAPTHLPLAHDVTYLFAKSSPRVPQLLLDTQGREVVGSLREALPTNFTGDGAEERLANALRGGSPWLIFWIVGRERDTHSVLPFDRWRDFSTVLLDLAEHQSAIGVPLIVPLVTQSEMTVDLRPNPSGQPEAYRATVGQFDEQTARFLFDYDRLVRVLASFDVPEDLDEELKAMCRAAVDAARTAKG